MVAVAALGGAKEDDDDVRWFRFLGCTALVLFLDLHIEFSACG